MGSLEVEFRAVVSRNISSVAVQLDGIFGPESIYWSVTQESCKLQNSPNFVAISHGVVLNFVNEFIIDGSGESSP